MMTAIETIRSMGIIYNDTANHILLDFMVGDKKHWKNQFNNCIYDMNSLKNVPYMRWIKYTDDYTFENMFIRCKEQKDKKAFNKVFKQNMLELQSNECFEYAIQFVDNFIIQADDEEAFIRL